MASSSRPTTLEQLGLEDDDVLEVEEVYAEEEEDDPVSFSRWDPTHAYVPVVLFRELPAGVGVYVPSLGE